METNKRALAILAAALLILGNTLLHTHVYGNRNYREDEIATIHTAGRLSPQKITRWIADTAHPPGWHILAAIWVDEFGRSEAVVRWSSKLLNLLSFALIFQLGKQLIDRRAALYAVAILGLYGFASNSIFELRPYSLMVALITALHLVFFRWLRKPTGRLMVAYVFLGVGAVNTHFYVIPVFAAHALYLVVFRRFNRRFVFNTVAMWFFITLSISPWILPLADSVLGVYSGGYPSLELPELIQAIQFEPNIVFEFLLLASLIALQRFQAFTAHRTSLRWYPFSRLAYPPFLLLATFAVALLVNAVWTVMNPRGFVSVAMLIALVMALGLWLLPARLAGALLLLLYIHAPANLLVQPTNGPYQEILQTMAPNYESDSVVVTEFSWAWRWLQPAAYYLMNFTPDMMSGDRIFHIIDPHDYAHPNDYPIELANVFNYFVPARFAKLLPSHRQLWRLSEGGGNFPGLELRDWLNKNYALIRTYNWDEPYLTSYALSEYSKVPDHQGPIILVGDELKLYTWALVDSAEVASCQTVDIDSWWRISAEIDDSYSLSVILANEDGDSQLANQNSIPADVFTTEWETERFYRDRSSLQIPCALASGRYNLLLAAKETLSGAALPLRYPDGSHVGNDEFYLTTLRVETS